jgi:hypothetical protein
MKIGSGESVCFELATLYVGDCGGEEMLEMLKSPILSPHRRTLARGAGGEAKGGGPGLATNFLLNEGTLKFGAGGEALRTSASGILGGDWLYGIPSERGTAGKSCNWADIYRDWRLAFP